jgi:hypothetical protein
LIFFSKVREKAKVMLDYLASDDILRDILADARRLKERLTRGEGCFFFFF